MHRLFCAASKLYNLNQPHHQSESYRKSKQPQNYRHGDLLVGADSCSAREHRIESHGSARSITGNLPSPLEFQRDRLAVTAACPSTQARVQIITGICRDRIDQGKKEASPPNDSTNKGSTEVVPVPRLGVGSNRLSIMPTIRSTLPELGESTGFEVWRCDNINALGRCHADGRWTSQTQR